MIKSASLIGCAVLWFLGSGLCFADSIAYFYALDQDLDVLKESASGMPTTAPCGSRTITRLQIGGHRVDAVKMGSGCVESALSAQALLAGKAYDLAISVGPAGQLSPAVSTGHWYRVDQVIRWQKGSETASGFRLHPDASLEVADASQRFAALPGDLVISGTGQVASGEAFISSAVQREQIRAMTGAVMVDMNSCGIAAACADHQIPLVILRIISDGADESSSETFRQFVEHYDGAGGRYVAHVIESLAPNPDHPASYPEIRSLLEKPD